MRALDLPELYQCVHCGLCLDQCPTYRSLHVEAESPRGRIHLVRAAAEGRIEANERFAGHLYLCLMCRACETACPSGVQYGRIAERARSVVPPPGSRLQRALLTLAFRHVLPYPLRLRALARFGFFTERSGLRALIRRIAPSRIKEMDAMLPPLSRHPFPSGPELLPAIGERRAKVGLLGGCAMGFLFADVSAAAARVLRLNGCDVWVPKDHGCCGALNVHYGERSTAAAMARRNIDAFLAAGLDAVIVSAAGCGAAMKEYGHLLDDDPAYAEKARRFSSLVKDFSEFLAGLGLRADPGRLELRATYQDPCHLAHGQRVRAQPRALLSAIPGLELIEMAGADQCCGSAGIYNLTHPEMAQELLQNKMAAIARTGAQAVVAPNPGCMMQLAYGARRYGPAVEVFHLADLLDRAYAGGHR